MKIKQRPNRCRTPRESLLTAVITIVLSISSPQALAQQWSTSGNDIHNTNSGNVGIGTNTPNAALEVIKSQNAGTSVVVDNPFTTGGHTAYSGFFLKQNGTFRLLVASVNDNHSFLTSGTGMLWNFANGPTVFATNNTEVMRLSAGGNLGIGTTSPTERLVTFGNFLAGNITRRTPLYAGYDLQSPVIMELGYGTPTANMTPQPSLVLSKNLTSSNNLIGVVSFANSNIADGNEKRIGGIASSTDGALNSGTLQFYTSAAGSFIERMRINASGNVGIGVVSPTTKLDVAGTVDADAFTVNGVAFASSQWTTTGTTINYSNGNVGIGTATPVEKLEVIGNIKVSGNINAKYQDVAEWVDSSQELPPGTVVVLDSSRLNHVIASTHSYDSRVAGVISRQPGLTLGEEAEGRVLVATTGRVKVKVDATGGPIQIGDLLVTSNHEGFAMKSLPLELGGVQMHRPSTLIGKALEPLAKGTGEILVLLSLQ